MARETQDLSKAQLAFQIAGGDVNQYLVLRYRGTEGLCQLFRFEIELSSTLASVSFDEIVGKGATLSINAEGIERYFHGVISRFEMTGETTDLTYYRAELVPSLWFLTHRYNSRIFQEMTTKDIVAAVLADGGVPSDQIVWQVDGSPAADKQRVFCVQYRETDYNFICRLLEEEGIRWFFEQDAQFGKLVLAYATDSYPAIAGESAALRYQAPTGLAVDTEHVFRFRMGQSVRPGAVVLRDFNWENPPLDLQATGSAGRDDGLEFSDYPGRYATQGDGTHYATLRAQEFEAGRTVAFGQSNCGRLAPGHTFDLTEYPSEPANGTYLITTVTHEGKQSTSRTTAGSNGRSSFLDVRSHQSLLQAQRSDDESVRTLASALLTLASKLRTGDPTANRTLTQWLYHGGQVCRELSATAAALGGSPLEALTIPNLMDDTPASGIVDVDAPIYQCRFECIPAAVAYRPPRVTPWPVMRGTQTARVVGPEGEEIYTDPYGRVKVQFHWDRVGEFNERSSCWVRVCQGWAGGNYGILFLPRIGQEVIVDFLEGNVDEPIVVGRVYNKDHMPPYTLPDEKTKSVIKGRSSLGGGGANEIRFEDLKDEEQLFIQAQRQMDLRVKANHNHTVGGSLHVHVGGECNGELKGELRELVFKDKHVHVKQHLFTWVEQEEHRAIGGLQAVEIGGTRSWLMRQDAIDVFEANHQHEVTATYYLKAANVKIEASAGLELVCGGSSIVLTPAAVFIVGPIVNINSGSGPPVAPTAVAGMCPGAAEDAGVADQSEPGTDTTYGGGGELVVHEPPEVVTGHEFPPPGGEETETSWIEIELKNQFGDPIASERFEITTSDGKIKNGSTDSNGKAKVSGIVPGECQIKFLDLDVDAVDKVG